MIIITNGPKKLLRKTKGWMDTNVLYILAIISVSGK